MIECEHKNIIDFHGLDVCSFCGLEVDTQIMIDSNSLYYTRRGRKKGDGYAYNLFSQLPMIPNRLYSIIKRVYFQTIGYNRILRGRNKRLILRLIHATQYNYNVF